MGVTRLGVIVNPDQRPLGQSVILSPLQLDQGVEFHGASLLDALARIDWGVRGLEALVTSLSYRG